MSTSLNQAVISIFLISALGACASTSSLGADAGKTQTVGGVTKTGADARLEDLSREDLAKNIPAPKHITAPTN